MSYSVQQQSQTVRGRDNVLQTWFRMVLFFTGAAYGTKGHFPLFVNHILTSTSFIGMRSSGLGSISWCIRLRHSVIHSYNARRLRRICTNTVGTNAQQSKITSASSSSSSSIISLFGNTKREKDSSDMWTINNVFRGSERPRWHLQLPFKKFYTTNKR